MTQESADKLIALLCILGAVFIFATLVIVSRSKYRRPQEPIDVDDIEKYDHLPPGIAVAYAWEESDVGSHLHEMRKDEVRAQMPLLARSLDRLVED